MPIKEKKRTKIEINIKQPNLIEEEWLKYENNGNYETFINVLENSNVNDYMYFRYIDKLILKGLSDNNKSLINYCMNIYCGYNKKNVDDFIEKKGKKKKVVVDVVDSEKEPDMYYLESLILSKLFKNNKNNEEKYKIIETYLSKKDANDLDLLSVFISILIPNKDMDETNIYNIDKIIEIYKKKFPNDDKYTNNFINKLFLIKSISTNLVIKNFLELFINKFIPKDYKFDNQNLGLLFHIGEISVLKENKLLNIEFLEYCFDKWIENIDIYLIKYNIKLKFILNNNYILKHINWNIVLNKENSSYMIDNYSSYNDYFNDYYYEYIDDEYIDGEYLDENKQHTNKLNWINKIEIFLEQKVIPTKKLFNSICKFIKNNNKLSNKCLIDITYFVNLMTKYGYNFTINDAINLVKDYLYISNINEYDIDLKDNELVKVIKELNYNPYNLKIELTIEILEEKCKNKLSLSDIKGILKQNKNLKLNDKCLENLIIYDNPNIISYIIKTYKLQPTMKCIKYAIENKWSSSKIKILFDPIYTDYLEKEKEKKIEIIKEPIECVPKKKK
jgi:hypothetical protein